MGVVASQITGVLFVCSGEIKENIKPSRHWPLWGEATGDWWIPLTASESASKAVTRKMFPFDDVIMERNSSNLFVVYIYIDKTDTIRHGPLIRYVKWRVAHAPGMPGTFPRPRGLAISTCISARAWRTCRDACRDRWLGVSFVLSGAENVPGIPCARATRSFAYLVRGPCKWWENDFVCLFRVFESSYGYVLSLYM